MHHSKHTVKGLFFTLAVFVPQAVAQPLWSDRIEREDMTGLFQRCTKRGDVPPSQGQRCSRQPKLCYFGTQDCDGIGPHPVTRCFCDGLAGSRTWDCQDVTCPTAASSQLPPCPAEKPDLNETCTADIECSYVSATKLEDGSPCTETTKCTCTASGTFTCEVTEIACVSADPPSITDVCPDTTPGPNVACTTDLECPYVSATTLGDGSPCTETTKCSCTSPGSFICATEIGCVSANPPSVTDACPETAPGLNVACTTDLVCSYDSATTLGDGSPCTETTTCTCTSPGDFTCDIAGISCVSADPPSITGV